MFYYSKEKTAEIDKFTCHSYSNMEKSMKISVNKLKHLKRIMKIFSRIAIAIYFDHFVILFSLKSKSIFDQISCNRETKSKTDHTLSESMVWSTLVKFKEIIENPIEKIRAT